MADYDTVPVKKSEWVHAMEEKNGS